MSSKYLDNTGLTYLWGKLKTIFVVDASYVHTDNNFTTTLKNKLNGIASGAEVNVQSDWNVTDSSSDAYIKNKPDIDVSGKMDKGAFFVDNDGYLSVDYDILLA